jgi:hypothetical protein
MSDFLVALGLVLVIEGLLWAAFPNAGRALLARLATTDDGALRQGGLVAIAVGVAVVWLVRG